MLVEFQDRLSQLLKLSDESLGFVKRNHVGSVALRPGRIRMGFDEETGNTDRNGGAGEDGHHGPVATG